jgi:predicted ATPase
MARSAMLEAVAQLAQALELLAALPAGDDRDEKELDLRIALGGGFITTKGFTASEVERSFERARRLCHQRTDHPDMPAVLSGLFLYHHHRSGTHLAHDIAGKLLRLAEQRRDIAACAVGHRCLAVSALFGGQHLLSLEHFEQALALYDRADRQAQLFLSQTDIRIASLNFIPLILLWRGHLDQAAARSRAALAAAYDLGHAYTLSHVLHLNCWLHQHLGDPTSVADRAHAALKVTEEHGFSLWKLNAEFWHGCALAAADEVASGCAQMRDAIATHKAMGMVNQIPHFLGLLASVQTQAGNPAEGLALLNEALAIVDRTQER